MKFFVIVLVLTLGQLKFGIFFLYFGYYDIFDLSLVLQVLDLDQIIELFHFQKVVLEVHVLLVCYG